jgi:hypothetical protein
MLRIGTSHFITRAAANRYYAAQGETAASVGRKLAAGEIHIGRPPRKAGQSVGVIPGEGRWYLIEEDSTTVPIGRPFDADKNQDLRDQIANSGDC